MHTTPLFLALLALAAPAPAQTITTLVQTGDVLDTGETVTIVYNCDVNNSGQWLVEARVDNATFDLDDRVIENGVVKFMEGSTMNIPGAAGRPLNWCDSLDVNDNGDILYLLNVDETSGGTTPLLVWNDLLVMEAGVTVFDDPNLPSGSTWEWISEVWQNDSDQFLIGGATDGGKDCLALVEHDGAGTLTSQTLIAIEGQQLPGHNLPIQGFYFTKTYNALNDSGQYLWPVDDESFYGDGTSNTCCDSWIYTNSTVTLHEGDPYVNDPARTLAHLSIVELDINEAGDWIASFNLDSSDSSNNSVILINGTDEFAREGSNVAGIPGGYALTSLGNGAVQLSDAGDVLWFADWDDPDTTVDSGLLVNNELLIQEGVTSIGGSLVDSFDTGSDARAMSDDGSRVVFTCTLADGREGIHMITRELWRGYCYGDGSGTSCPCGNAGGPGEGCANSTGLGATLSVEGTLSISAGDAVLRGDQAAPNQPGLYFQGTSEIAGGDGIVFGDGLRCAGGSIIRLQLVAADSSGSSQTNIDLGAAGGVVAGETYTYQLWYRDPISSPCGNPFNLSSAVSATWRP